MENKQNNYSITLPIWLVMLIGGVLISVIIYAFVGMFNKGDEVRFYKNRIKENKAMIDSLSKSQDLSLKKISDLKKQYEFRLDSLSKIDTIIINKKSIVKTKKDSINEITNNKITTDSTGLVNFFTNFRD